LNLQPRQQLYSATLGSIKLATTLAADFADADTVDAVPVDLVTTMKTWLAAPTEANFFQCTKYFELMFKNIRGKIRLN
jgi:hypothetical protein